LAPTDEAAWRKQIVDGRAEADAEFKSSPTSPLTAIERRVLRGPEPTYVEVADETVRFTGEPGAGAALSFRRTAPDKWTWEPGRGELTATARGGEKLPPGPVAGPAVFRLGRFSLLAQPLEGDLAVMIHDAKRSEREFRGLSYFAPDRRYAVEAKVERQDDTGTVTMPTTLKLEKSYRRYARLKFTVAGRAAELSAYKPVGAPAGFLFIPFRDSTNGQSTYGGGRYIDAQEPAGDTLLLDFNQAYNPMCNYSAAYNCPIPPAENRLRIAIEAGQKTYEEPPGHSSTM